MSTAEKTTLRAQAEQACAARLAAWEEQRRKDAAEERAAQIEELRREAEAQLGEHLYTSESLVGFDADGNLLLELEDDVLLHYVPRHHHEYGVREGEFYLAEPGPDGILDHGRRVGDRYGTPAHALAELGEALRQGVTHPARDEDGEVIVSSPRSGPTPERQAETAIAYAEEVIHAGEGFVDPQAAAALAVAKTLYALYYYGHGIRE